MVNNIGPLTLFQAVLPLLTASPTPKFCLIGNAVGSFGAMGKYPFPMAGYGMSKAMAHYLVRKIHFEYGGENGRLVAWCVYPGNPALSFTFGTVMRRETRERVS
jgi:norsolorinic acid ketoreductase